MNSGHKGKIARLPLQVRELLNQRLRDGEQGKKLVAWLNSLPEVHAVIAAGFAGQPINGQNLTNWKQGGYRDWLEYQQAREVMARLQEELPEGGDPEGPALSETLARWLAARYAVATRRVLETEGPEQWRLLRELCGDVVELRRGDHSAKRLEIERNRLEAYECEVETKGKRKLDIGLLALRDAIQGYPEARAAYKNLEDIVKKAKPEEFA